MRKTITLFIFILSSYSYAANSWHRSIRPFQINKMKSSCINNRKPLDCYTVAIHLQEYNKEEALRFLKLSCHYEKDNAFCTRYGLKLTEIGKVQKGLDILTDKCSEDYPDACLYSGLVMRSLYFLQTDRFVKKRTKRQAIGFFNKACGLGDDWSCQNDVKW